MRTTIKITSGVLQIALFASIIFLFFTFLSARLSVFGLRSFTVITGSMEPKIKVGSVVFTKSFEDYKIGNVITFNRGNLSITHRIAGLKNGGYVTKGDANEAADREIVYKSNVVGRDVFIVPFLGKFVAFLKTPPGFSLFIGVPIIIYIILEARVFKREWEKEIEKRVLRENHILEMEPL